MYQLIDYRDLIAVFETNANIARFIGVNRSTVSRWKGTVPLNFQGLVIQTLINNPVKGMSVAMVRVKRELAEHDSSTQKQGES